MNSTSINYPMGNSGLCLPGCVRIRKALEAALRVLPGLRRNKRLSIEASLLTPSNDCRVWRSQLRALVAEAAEWA